MQKNWKKRIGVFFILAVVTYVAIRLILGTSFTSDNFPLSEKWSIRIGENIQQISIVDSQIVLVRTGSKLYALDIKSGNKLWHRDTGWLANNEPAQVKNNIVFFTDNKWVWALKLSSGEVLWQKQLYSPETAQIVAANQDVVAVFDWQYLFVYQNLDGTLLWRKPVCRNSAPAYFNDSKLYFPCSGLSAVDVYSGETIWEEKTAQTIWIAVYADGIIYSSPDYENITAFDLENRKQLWNTPLSTDGEQKLKIVDELLFISDGTHFCVLQRYDGKRLWCADRILNPQNPAKISDIVFIFNGPQNVITAFDIDSGTKLGQLKITNLNLFTISRQLMVSSSELLIFASGRDVFAFSK